jgi:hypothetical protein
MIHRSSKNMNPLQVQQHKSERRPQVAHFLPANEGDPSGQEYVDPVSDVLAMARLQLAVKTHHDEIEVVFILKACLHTSQEGRTNLLVDLNEEISL